jgi:uncharacterized protein YlxP (DUF503 family)
MELKADHYQIRNLEDKRRVDKEIMNRIKTI